MLYVRYVHLAKDKHIHKRHTHPLVREELHKHYDRKRSVEKKVSGRVPQGTWRRDELIGGKPQVVKYLWL
jgi:hypothetical protein